MNQLELLDLSRNLLSERSVPFWVSQIRVKNLKLAGNKVRYFEISSNSSEMSAVSHGIGQIANLEELDLSDNTITEVPLTLVTFTM